MGLPQATHIIRVVPKANGVMVETYVPGMRVALHLPFTRHFCDFP